MYKHFVTCFCASVVLGGAPSAYAAGSGSAGSAPSASPSAPTESRAAAEDPVAAAQRLYNDGVKLVQKADKISDDAKKADKGYVAALKKFESAVERNPQQAEGWNYVGYCRRKTGDHGGALGAYDEALRLKPGFPEALEYRGHAYLGLGRIADSQRDYVDLFGRNRALAGQLLAGMRVWSATQRSGGNSDAKALDQLDAWIAEREKAAQQTAALSRAGSAAGWN